MKELQRLFASFVLVCILAAGASADGIIQTGTPPPPPPTNSSSDEPADAEEPTGEDASIIEAATAAALDILQNALTLF
ncbi:MAG: hypothetical protein LC800_12385 [Acidobacteria bacterium]|nr:hypothetical protein [Acidobacteriota bacterium]